MNRNTLLICCILLCSYNYANAQADTTNRLDEYVVTGIRDDNIKATSLHIESHSLEMLERTAPYNLSDALAKLPGISQISTGNAISKPVIRGLYGNRILVLLSGLRFDNQQFQDEHGLGLSQIGIDRVEVIRGPASLLYGTDAVGGIINIIEEQPEEKEKRLDINTRFYSNTIGTLTDAGYAANNGTTNWRLRAGIESHADYTDGAGNRITDSRNKGYYLKAGFGFRHKNWTQSNSYNFSYNQYGFVIDSLHKLDNTTNRFSRAMSGPHHNVLLNIFSSQNTFLLKSSVLKINAGIQSNKRAEDEGGGEISLNMHLLSLLENAKWEKSLSRRVLFVLNQQLTHEQNTNYGKRKIIPDADMTEGNVSAFFRFYLNKINIETGAGFNNKTINTYKTGILNTANENTPDTSIQPFRKTTSSFNLMLGASYNPNDWLNIKSNISTGTRAPNLAELSSNGLHEGVYRCEIGNPNLDMEQNINTDLTIEISRKWLFVSASAFYNKFFNYIYLSPTNEPLWYGFVRYRYRQDDAHLQGGEITAIVQPVSGWQLRDVFSTVKGQLDNNGGYLPFIPANRNLLSVKYEKDFNQKLTGFFISPEWEAVAAQNNAALFETPTPAYSLFHIHTGINTYAGKQLLKWSLSCRNVFDKPYIDHLSRLKYYGINNPGINFVLTMKTDIGL